MLWLQGLKSLCFVCLCASNLYVHVQPVVEVSQPEEVCEAQRDVKRTELLVSQRQQAKDIQVVLVPPAPIQSTRGRRQQKVDVCDKLQSYFKNNQRQRLVCGRSPGDLLVPWCQVTIHKAERGPVEHEGNADGSLVTFQHTHIIVLTTLNNGGKLQSTKNTENEKKNKNLLSWIN